MKRIAVNVGDDEHEEIFKWAQCEGCSMSSYLVKLHRDYMHRAKNEGLRTPESDNGDPK